LTRRVLLAVSLLTKVVGQVLSRDSILQARRYKQVTRRGCCTIADCNMSCDAAPRRTVDVFGRTGLRSDGRDRPVATCVPRCGGPAAAWRGSKSSDAPVTMRRGAARTRRATAHGTTALRSSCEEAFEHHENGLSLNLRLKRILTPGKLQPGIEAFTLKERGNQDAGNFQAGFEALRL
jgi:hypothetical protein